MLTLSSTSLSILLRQIELSLTTTLETLCKHFDFLNSSSFNTPDSTAERKGKFLKYGPFKNVKPFTYSEMMVHFKYNVPLPIFTEVKKTIEVSHWGNILVDEYYELINQAAGIKGEFGRVDYQHWDTNMA